MQVYYIRHNNENLGPYSVEELKSLGVTRKDFVWKEGLANWQKAGEVAELADLFAHAAPPPFTKPQAAPPPFAQPQMCPPPVYSQQPSYYQPASSAEKVGFRIGKFLGWGGILAVIIALTSYMVYSSQESGYDPALMSRPKTPEEMRAELLEQERMNPAQYLVEEVTMRGNLIGEKVFEGTITNKASVAVFKDVVLEVQFLSKTDAVIGSRQLVVYEVLAPKERKKFKIKTFAPSETRGFGAAVVNATPVR